ncbi:HlyD family secretion protein [Malonomonas rubra]|uniref:HlyD family secretion protein n=1 Tax=Malonomonas rubra TaxID=57040 RepID=UPI0026F02B36|nr:HlyD family efflux transporter periplasmic adaptor subunit [Malonomonas rubra]
MKCLLGIILLLGAAVLCGCQKEVDPVFQGYVEGEFVLVAAPLAGHLEVLTVQRGEYVAGGTPLFVLEQAQEQTAVEISERDLQRVKSRLDDLQKGQRPSELQELAARVEKAQAGLELARKEFERRQRLLETQTISVEEFERARTDSQRAKSALEEMQAVYATAKLGARSDTIAAAQAELAAARGRVEQARWALEQKTKTAPEAALVEDTFYRVGEFVPAGYPVVSLLPAANIKLRFFVPEPQLGTLSLGQAIAVSYDGSDGSLPATISFISTQAEYTPPVIFSRETRSKLVFMVEARPDPAVAKRLHPGQPVDIRLE